MGYGFQAVTLLSIYLVRAVVNAVIELSIRLFFTSTHYKNNSSIDNFYTHSPTPLILPTH
jgi:hypothetical protein